MEAKSTHLQAAKALPDFGLLLHSACASSSAVVRCELCSLEGGEACLLAFTLLNSWLLLLLLCC